MSLRRRLPWLAEDSPADAFPDPNTAFPEPNGLLAAGGDLSPQRLIAAYRRGIFPWFGPGQPILWWCPDPRAVLLPEEFHLSRRLLRSLRGGDYTLSINCSFDSVIAACAAARAATGTWLTPEMISAYTRLHPLGIAHSVEAWCGGELVGGVYGIGLGSVFFGESMVSLKVNGSKIALAGLAAFSRAHGIGLIDCQIANPHLESLGSRCIPRAQFLSWITAAVHEPPVKRLTAQPPQPAVTVLGC
jgi:leucyl/phenylalanyl-tRNA---protein transferase